MTKIKANFSEIKGAFGTIPDDVYEGYVVETKSDETTTKKPRETIIVVVDDPDPDKAKYNGKQLWDQLTMETNDGKPNKFSLGRIKDYAIAILGEDNANGDEIDTADFVNGRALFVVGHDDWTVEEKDAKGKVVQGPDGKPKMRSGTTNKIERVLPTGE